MTSESQGKHVFSSTNIHNNVLFYIGYAFFDLCLKIKMIDRQLSKNIFLIHNSLSYNLQEHFKIQILYACLS